MERVMAELANQFCQMPQKEVHLVLYGIKRDIFYNVSNKIIIHKPVFEFNNQKRFWHTIKTVWFIRKKIKEIHPQTILSFGEYWNNLILLSCIGLRFPIYISDRSQPDKQLGKFQDALRRWLYPKAKGIIAQTKTAQLIYSDLYTHSNIEVIGNPIKKIPVKIDAIRENVVLTVGRLIKTKHHDELIKLFMQINKPDWKLIIVGDDALKEQNKVRLQNLIKKLGGEQQVILTGKRTDVDDFYSRSKIFAFTSSSEGFPNVIGEALSAGLPTVAFDCISGPSDMIEDGFNGYLIDLFDFESFRSKLSLLMGDEQERERMSLNAVSSISKFNTQNIAAKYHKFITGHLN